MSIVEPKKVATFLRAEIDELKAGNPVNLAQVTELEAMLTAEPALAAERQRLRRLASECDERSSELAKIEKAIAEMRSDLAAMKAEQVTARAARADAIATARVDGKPFQMPQERGLDQDSIDALDEAIIKLESRKATVVQQLDALRTRRESARLRAVRLRRLISEGALAVLTRETQKVLAEIYCTYRMEGQSGWMVDHSIAVDTFIADNAIQRLRSELPDLVA